MSKDKTLPQIPIYKIVMLGCSSVGKTSMVNQFVNNYFEPLNEETNDDWREYIKLVNLNTLQSPQYCVLKIVDLFGIDHDDLKEGGDPKKHEMLKKLIKNEGAQSEKDKDKPDKEVLQTNPIYRDKQVYGYMFVYDVTNYESLEKVREFIDFIVDNERIASTTHSIVTKKMLVGNKTDLTKRDAEKVKKTFKELLTKTKIMITECSAFESTRVDQCFEDLAKAINKDVSYEAYEKEHAQESLGQDTDKETSKKSIHKGGQSKAGGGGFLGCGGTRKDADDSDEEGTGPDTREEELVDTNLPEMNVNKAGGCSLF